MERLYAYGSVLGPAFGPESDVDIIVAFSPKTGEISRFKIFFGLKAELEKLFARKVDLMVEKPIRNPILREEIEQTKQLIYGKESTEMAV